MLQGLLLEVCILAILSFCVQCSGMHLVWSFRMLLGEIGYWNCLSGEPSSSWIAQNCWDLSSVINCWNYDGVHNVHISAPCIIKMRSMWIRLPRKGLWTCHKAIKHSNAQKQIKHKKNAHIGISKTQHDDGGDPALILTGKAWRNKGRKKQNKWTIRR